MDPLTIAAIRSVPYDEKVHLLHLLSHHSGFFVSDGCLLYAAQVLTKKITRFSTKTRCLELNLAVEFKAVVVDDTVGLPDGVYDIIQLYPNASDAEIHAFIKVCETHASSGERQSFEEFFSSLITLFQAERVQDKLNAIGLYGELMFIERASSYKGMTDVATFWQRLGLHSKYDFTFPYGNIEIKTTSQDTSQVLIKHAQLFNEDTNYLATVSIERSPSGETLNELAARLQSSESCFTTLGPTILLQKAMLNIDESEKEIPFSLRDFSLYEVSGINQFGVLPSRVSELTYRIDVVDLPTISLEAVFSKLYANQST